jgi:Fe-S cluster assembly ATP-binding protein
MLTIKNLKANIDNKEILKGLNLEIKPGEVHAIMGPNGSGKSTLSNVLSGKKGYTVTGEVKYFNENLLELEIEERAHKGIFLAFQYPLEIPGVNTNIFLKTSLNAIKKAKGEKESILNPKLSILDETDSGLDIDALKIVSEGVNALRSKDSSFLIITHYQRLLDYIKPDFVHVLINGQIVKSGGSELAMELESKGYETLS